MTDRRAYLFIYNDDVGTREEIRDYLAELPEVLNWRDDMPYASYVISPVQCAGDRRENPRVRGRWPSADRCREQTRLAAETHMDASQRGCSPANVCRTSKSCTAEATQNQRGLSEVG